MDLAWTTYGFVLDGDKLWFATYLWNFLCCYSLTTKKVECLEMIPTEKYVELPYSNLAKVGNNIIIIPANANNLCIYNIEEKTFWNTKLEERDINKFYAYGIYEDNIFLFPGKYSAILKLNLKTREIQYITEWRNDIETEGKVVDFQFCHCTDGHKIYLLSATTNKIMIFDMKEESINTIEIGSKGKIYSTITHLEDGRFLLTDEKGNCILTDLTNNYFYEIENKIDGFIAHRYDDFRTCFSSAIEFNGFVYVFPAQANRIIKLSLKDKCLAEVNMNYTSLAFPWKGEAYSLVQRKNNCVFGFWILMGVFFKFNLETEQIEFHEIHIDDVYGTRGTEILCDILSREIAIESVTPFASINKFIECVDKKDPLEVNDNYGSIGEKIFNSL